ncbi:glycoside hydrolase family 32 protein [Maribacter algarum]|uniref:Glycoside hydrolase family 32 protein n=1 Tax=Maribacter algarum (ex Zhang et al. 2020) TaxID=2578118 RepID=A0A5S3PWQ6_9FLAO|nr:glycoside hydrolase family 32 protein [Maribacter algarum]TMM59466.1 glycoside hydrolase family 32 protein [Maribacter algarum]
MNLPTKLLIFVFAFTTLFSCKNKDPKPEVAATVKTDYYTEPYRPQFHFSPEEKWMNDPNGMVYHKGIYHLFYQYYPEDIVWGPMHWGHAISKDLVSWEHKPIALFPDKHGLIFSGSAVVDFANTSGFGTEDNPPLVAIFTYHLMEGEQAGRKDFQTQGIAYSLDNGDTWTKYEGNPVIGNDGIKDFRDPKVFWDKVNHTWVMALVAGDHLQLWNSDDLKKWTKLSEFGKDKGAHGGVWECPDLFPLKVEGTDEEKWVLLISINPGAPNGGSGTQYFVGDFDGEKFTTDQTDIKWLDWGTDNYAGVTYNVLPENYYGNNYANDPGQDRILIGWMSNWTYARDTPTEKWRSAMTIPRKLSLQKLGDDFSLFNYPIRNFELLINREGKKDITVAQGEPEILLFENFNQTEIQFIIDSKDFRLTFGNSNGDKLGLGIDSEIHEFGIDRSKSGRVDFQEDFASIPQMPVNDLPDSEYEVRIILDLSSIEVFLNKGQYVMTAQIFPTENYTDLTIENPGGSEINLKDFEINKVKRIWK